MHPDRSKIEIANLAKVEEAISSYVQQGRSIGQSVSFGLHQMLMEGIPEDPSRPIKPGKLRTLTEHVTADGAKHLNQLIMHPASLPGAFVDLLEAADRQNLPQASPDGAAPIIEQAARLHYRFVQMHPFCDGNGRMARTLATWLLGREDTDIFDHTVPINSVLLEHRDDYLSTLAYCDELYAELTSCGLEREEALVWCEMPFVHFYGIAVIVSYREETKAISERHRIQNETTSKNLQLLVDRRALLDFQTVKAVLPADQVIQIALGQQY
ncbi:hypothetical protein BH24ACT22_BH24ACT22_02500 [soil metagenome]